MNWEKRKKASAKKRSRHTFNYFESDTSILEQASREKRSICARTIREFLSCVSYSLKKHDAILPIWANICGVKDNISSHNFVCHHHRPPSLTLCVCYCTFKTSTCKWPPIRFINLSLLAYFTIIALLKLAKLLNAGRWYVNAYMVVNLSL